jgi:hypothetical protein
MAGLDPAIHVFPLKIIFEQMVMWRQRGCPD